MSRIVITCLSSVSSGPYGLIDLEKRFFVPEDDEKIGRRAIVIWKALLEENSVVL